MKIIEYSEQGVAYSDHRAEDIAREFLRGDDDYICVSTENIITATRALVKEKYILHDQVQFLFREEPLAMDRGGGLYHWPRGFCDSTEGWLMRLLAKD
jgi:hypothetical protein